MSRRSATAIALIVLVLATGVGVLDAVLERSDDHLALFAVALGAALALVTMTFVSDPTVAVRRDVLRWATQRAQLTGEPVDRILNRAWDGYRFLLEPAGDSETPSDGASETPTAAIVVGGPDREG